MTHVEQADDSGLSWNGVGYFKTRSKSMILGVTYKPEESSIGLGFCGPNPLNGDPRPSGQSNDA